MALDTQIEWAARKPSKPSSSSMFTDEAVLAPIPRTMQDILDREFARWTVRRVANRHGCTGHCDKPEHADDAAVIGEVWDMLGLLPGTDDEPAPDLTFTPAAAPPRLKVELARVAADMEWTDRAACLDVDPDLHFPVKTCGPDFEVQAREAKAVCGGCPVRYRCLRWALDRNEQHGIWGGYTADERKSLKRRERRRRAA